MICYSKTAIGYSHIKNKTKCQDFSSNFTSKDRQIITCCDGHGGNIYVRSDVGSKIASNTIYKVFIDFDKSAFTKSNVDEIISDLKHRIVTVWREDVMKHFNSHPFTPYEIYKLNDSEKERLTKDPIKAYGTTLNAAIKIGDRLIAVKLGDGESLLLKKAEICSVFEEKEDDPVANITYSMCAEDVEEHLEIKVIKFDKTIKGILICSDGLVNPYQSYNNFKCSFIIPALESVLTTKNTAELEYFIKKIGYDIGIGDDVSLGIMFRENINPEDYK